MATRTLKRAAQPKLSASPLRANTPVNEVCLELQDHGTTRKSAVEFFGLSKLRDPHPAAARLTDQFANQNRRLLELLDVRMYSDYDGRDVRLVIEAGSAVGAIPLLSPTSARPDFGLLVQPRFPWAGIGPMLAEMGWRISPTPLRLPMLRRSERRIPPWVLSSMILVRLSALLDSLDRRFENVTEDRNAPRGSVHWQEYATNRLPHANFLSIPCTFPDLRDDRQLKGAIRYTVEKQMRSLETQKEHGGFVVRLLEFAAQLHRRVQMVPTHIPSRRTVDSWLQRPMRGENFLNGVQSIEWTVEDRGLAGLSDLEGLAWRMPMDQFFEAWVETVLLKVAQRTGGNLKVGRKRETIQSIHWEPSFLGTQKALIPDLWLEFAELTVIVDAKYKRHWEELQQHSWSRVTDILREQHRNDLLQVLAYANLAQTAKVVACLLYPCTAESWQSLRDRGRLHHKAEINIGTRSIQLWLTAIPMATAIDKIIEPFTEQIRQLLAQLRSNN